MDLEMRRIGLVYTKAQIRLDLKAQRLGCT